MPAKMLHPGAELKVLLALREVRARDIAPLVGLSEFEFSRIVNGRREADPQLLDRIRAVIVTSGRS